MTTTNTLADPIVIVGAARTLLAIEDSMPEALAAAPERAF